MIAAIQTLSPVHIGSGSDIPPLEYWIQDVFVCLNMAGIFKDPRFAHYSDAFIQKACQSRYIGDILPVRLLSDHYRYWTPLAPEAGAHLTNNQIDVKDFVKSAGRVYIPGSSVKGAILSACIHNALSELYSDSNHKHKIESLLSTPKDRKSFPSLLNMAFSHLIKAQAGKNADRFSTWMKVGDSSMNTPDKALEVIKAEVRGAKSDKSLPVLMEAVPAGKQFFLEMTVSEALKWELDTMMQLVDCFYRAVWQNSMGTSPPKEDGWLMRLGQGSSVYATSLLIFARENNLGRDIYNVLPPRTRKIAEGENLMGWVTIRKTEAGQCPVGQGLATPAPLPMRLNPPLESFPGKTAKSIVSSREEVKKPKPVVLTRDSGSEGLLAQIRVIRDDDAFALARIVEAMDNMSDEDGRRIVAEALKEKLQACGKWQKHRLRADIEFYLSED